MHGLFTAQNGGSSMGGACPFGLGFRHRLVALLPARYRLRCRDTASCFRSWYARAIAGSSESACLATEKGCFCAAVNTSRQSRGQFDTADPDKASVIGGPSSCGQDHDAVNRNCRTVYRWPLNNHPGMTARTKTAAAPAPPSTVPKTPCRRQSAAGRLAPSCLPAPLPCPAR